MKVHLLDRAAMHRALGVQKARIHRLGIFPDRPRKRHGIQKGHDLGRTRAAVCMLCMRRVCSLLLPVDGYGDVRTADAALGIRRGGHHCPAAERRVHPGEKRRRIGMQLQQRRREHIAGTAHGTVNI